MLSRRSFSAGLVASATLALGTQAKAQIAYAEVPNGPWTKQGQLTRAGGQLHYAIIGDDETQPPVVLLHKLGGWMADWRFVAPLLASRRKIIAFDLPGHGNSSWQAPPPYIQTLGETAALLVGALTELGIQQIDLVGTSLGGCVGVPLAAYWPDRVRKLALVSCALGSARSLAEVRTAIDEKQKTLFDASGAPLPTDASLLTKIFGIIHADTISAEGNASRRRARAWIQPSERGVAVTDIKGILPRVAAPTLLLYGDRDPDYIKFRAGAEAALRSHQTVFVREAGAFVMQDNPKGTAEALDAFLNR